MEFFLFLFFSTILLFSSLNVIFVKNSVQAVFFLIFAFCNGVGLLFLVEIEFIALLFLVVYVGAIAVLFLFVIIILNLKSDINLKFDTTKSIQQYYPISFFIIFFIFFNFFTIRDILTSFNFSTISKPQYLEYIYHIDSIQSLNFFAQTLYTFYFFYFLLAGFILLVAILGAISLTSQKNNLVSFKKKQQIFSQLTRDVYSSVFLVKRKG